ncbi:MAG: hypothetical protein ACLS7U_12715, partial [Enterocloster sp.]
MPLPYWQPAWAFSYICRLTNLRLYAYLPAYAGGLSAYLLFLIVKCVWLDLAYNVHDRAITGFN